MRLEIPIHVRILQILLVYYAGTTLIVHKYCMCTIVQGAHINYLLTNSFIVIHGFRMRNVALDARTYLDWRQIVNNRITQSGAPKSAKFRGGG